MTDVLCAPGWRVRAGTPPRALAGANGMQIGPDGALYAVSAFGSLLVRIDVDSGEVTELSPVGDGIVSPDDLAFDTTGAVYVTECMNGRVSAWADGRVRVIADGLIGPNGISALGDRVFVDEFRPGGRVLEVFPDGTPPKVLVEGLAGPNGMAVAPDGMAYIAQVFTGDVVRVPVDGGPASTVVDGLAAPSSVRLAPSGNLLVSLGGSGEVLEVDPRTAATRIVGRAREGIDNLAITPDGRLFISYYIDGAVAEILGHEVREILPPGLLGPYALAPNGTSVYVADGLGMAAVSRDGSLTRVAKITDEGFPGPAFVRTLAAGADGLAVGIADGRLAWFDPDRHSSRIVVEGLDEPGGLLADDDGVLVVETGRGRLLWVDSSGGCTTVADGFARPVDVCAIAPGAWLVSDEERGELVVVRRDGSSERVCEGLDRPQGVAALGDDVLVVEAGAQRLVSLRPGSGRPVVAAERLPIGLPGGALRPTHNGLPQIIEGPIAPFASVACGTDAAVFVGGDATGTVTVLERTS